jgi:hypothetical protein
MLFATGGNTVVALALISVSCCVLIGAFTEIALVFK